MLYLAPSGLGTACKARAARMQRVTDSWYVRKHQHCCCCCCCCCRIDTVDTVDTTAHHTPKYIIWYHNYNWQTPPQRNLFIFLKYVTHFSRICLLLSEYVRLSLFQDTSSSVLRWWQTAVYIRPGLARLPRRSLSCFTRRANTLMCVGCAQLQVETGSRSLHQVLGRDRRLAACQTQPNKKYNKQEGFVGSFNENNWLDPRWRWSRECTRELIPEPTSSPSLLFRRLVRSRWVPILKCSVTKHNDTLFPKLLATSPAATVQQSTRFSLPIHLTAVRARLSIRCRQSLCKHYYCCGYGLPCSYHASLLFWRRHQVLAYLAYIRIGFVIGVVPSPEADASHTTHSRDLAIWWDAIRWNGLPVATIPTRWCRAPL